VKLLSATFVAFFLLLNIYSRAANDTLTIGQAFDFKIGDTLIYAGQETSSFFWSQGTIYSPPWGFTILNRQNGFDTIDYTYKSLSILDSGIHHLIVTHLDSATDFAGIFASFQQYVFFGFHGGFSYDGMLHHIHSCDSDAMSCGGYSYMDTSIFNRLAARNGIHYFEAGYESTFMEHIGVLKGYFWSAGYIITSNYYDGSCSMELAYYKSDTVGWGMIPTGLQESFGSRPLFNLFPNPSQGRVFIKLLPEEYSKNLSIEIYDSKYRLILSKNSFGSAEKIEMDLSSLSSGLYMVTIIDEKSNIIARQKLVRE
jgi:hypothetical protein